MYPRPMSFSGVQAFGKWRIKPSGKLPIFLRFIINAFSPVEYLKKYGINHALLNRTYLDHMIYWPAAEYDAYEKDILEHMEKDYRWFDEVYAKNELARTKVMYADGLTLKKVDWSKNTAHQMEKTLDGILERYKECVGLWYCQHPLDEFFETKIESRLSEYISTDDPDFRKLTLIFSDPSAMTEVSEERWKLTRMAKKFFADGEDLDNLSGGAKASIAEHLDKFAYINRGLATSKPSTLEDIVERLKEMKSQIDKGTLIDDLIYLASEEKVEDDFKWALDKIKPKKDFREDIERARTNSYVRNRRVEAFFNADYGANFMYEEIARRAGFDPDLVMEISVPEMYGALHGKPLPSKKEMDARDKNYAMVARDGVTTLITDSTEIEKMRKEYFVDVHQKDEMQGRVACLGGIIRGTAKVCLDKSEIEKVLRGDILVAQFTTPDFVPAMERAAAIVADQGGLSSHAAIVSRELGVPCVIATQNGSRLIHDGDLLEVDATKGIVKILEHAHA